MKCCRGRLQKEWGWVGGSVDTPIGRKVKDERKCRGGQIYSTACAPTRAMCTQRKAPWCFPRTIIPLSVTTGIRNDSECTSTLPPHFFCLFLSFSPSHSLSLDRNSVEFTAQSCVCVCVLFKGSVPHPSSVLAPVQCASLHNQYQICPIPNLFTVQ